MIEFDSHSVKPSSSSSVGTSEFGFIARYAASFVLPKAPPTSMRSNGTFISPSAQMTFCTFDEVLRPQILSTGCLRSWLLDVGSWPIAHSLQLIAKAPSASHCLGIFANLITFEYLAISAR